MFIKLLNHPWPNLNGERGSLNGSYMSYLKSSITLISPDKKNAIFGNYFKLLSRPRKLKDLLFLALHLGRPWRFSSSVHYFRWRFKEGLHNPCCLCYFVFSFLFPIYKFYCPPKYPQKCSIFFYQHQKKINVVSLKAIQKCPNK